MPPRAAPTYKRSTRSPARAKASVVGPLAARALKPGAHGEVVGLFDQSLYVKLDAGWVCLAGAMDELGYRPDYLEYVETYIFNSDKCMAVFTPS